MAGRCGWGFRWRSSASTQESEPGSGKHNGAWQSYAVTLSTSTELETPMTFARPLLAIALLTLAWPVLADQPTVRAGTAPPPSLEQIMADPQWIGPAVESPFWRLDGQAVGFKLERVDSALRDNFQIAAEGGAMSAVDARAWAESDGQAPVFDSTRRYAAFVRDGDLFIRDLRSQKLTAVTRSAVDEAEPQWQTDGSLAYRVGDDWFQYWPARNLSRTLAILKAEADPADPPEAGSLSEDALRLSSIVARQRANLEAVRAEARARSAADPEAAGLPIWIGKDLAIESSALSPRGDRLIVVVADGAENSGQAGKLPKFVTESGYTEIEDVRTKVGLDPPRGHRLLSVSLPAGEVQAVDLSALPGIDTDPLAALRRAADAPALDGDRLVRVEGIAFSDDGAEAVAMLRTIDNKDRYLAGIPAASKGPIKAVSRHRLTDDAWINWNFNEFGFVPGQHTLWFMSEESGYGHLYVQSTGGRAKALTHGNVEIYSPQPLADGTGFIAVSNVESPGDYELVRIPIDGGSPKPLTALDGVESFVLSPQQDRALVSWSGSYIPSQLATVDLDDGATVKLTDTRTKTFRAYDWPAPIFVEVPSSHGQRPIAGKLYLPPAGSVSPKPAVLFVHGAGYTQNVHHRYPYYFREQMFHARLAALGHVVLDLDYRGSEGYGRDWRTAIYRQMGYPELDDYLDGIDWLVREHKVDPARVGIYGGSYGGFMTLMALFRAPEAFAGGAALRPVTDWRAYNHEYTSNILNTPDIDMEAHRKSSPIEYAEGLADPLLIAHGMLDDNVFYEDSVRLAQRLIELRKEDWELAGYPLERHSFVEPESWLDEYRRIEKLFMGALWPLGQAPVPQ